MAICGVRTLEDEARSPSPALPVFYFATTLAASSIAFLHEIFVRQRAAYLEPTCPAAARFISLGAVLAAALGFLAAARTRPGDVRGDPRPRLLWALFVLAVSAALSGPLLFWAFAAEQRLVPVAASLCVSTAFVLALALRSAVTLLRGALLDLGFVSWAAAPLRLLSAALVLAIAAAAGAAIGVWRSAAAVGMSLAVLCGWAPSLFAFLDGVPAQNRLQRLVCALPLLISSVSFAASLLFFPLVDHDTYGTEVIFTRKGAHRRYVITSSQQSHELFLDTMLRSSSTDDYRFAEALVHPAFSVAAARARILILGEPDGVTEREVLRYPEVASVQVVTLDAELAQLGRSAAWLKSRSAGALDSKRVAVIEAEPIVWLAASPALFDVILVDLPDPMTAADGKNYTRYFYRLLGAHLSPGGVIAVQATSLSTTPRTFASIRRTLEASGFTTRPYHAGIPSLGDWGYILAFQQPPPPAKPLPAGLRFLSDATLPELFALPARTPHFEGAVSTLQHQVTLSIFEEERRPLSSR